MRKPELLGDYPRGLTSLGWSDDLATGVYALDAHNQSLIFALNALFVSGVQCEPGGRFCQKIEQTIRFLARGHAAEEAAMVAAGDPLRLAHEKEHRALLAELEAMKQTYACGGYDARAVFERLGAWTLAHIRDWDKPLGAHLRGATGRGPAGSGAIASSEIKPKELEACG